uniref:Leucine rich repeat containing 74B n=1 Tax=Salarias fasciatus TaxID=181472 RepID=A0A672IG31_SALFA
CQQIEISKSKSTNDEEQYDPTGQTCYRKACEMLQVVPVSHFLKHMQCSELDLMHRGLGPQGTKALAVPLVTNTSVLRLNLRDNWMEGMGGAAIAKMLKENCYITEVDLSDNNLGDDGARAMAGMLKENNTLLSLSLSGNRFTDRCSEDLGSALVANSRLQHLDLSYNALGELAGSVSFLLSDRRNQYLTISLRYLILCNLAWGHLYGGNVFLRKLDLSFNGLAREGALALGQTLRDNNVLEELNVRYDNNRIPPEGAIRLAMGLKANKTIKSLNISRNPILSAGCYGILQSMQDNPNSALEVLDFSDITVNQDFEDLYLSVKETFPALQVNHGAKLAHSEV